MNPPAVNPQKDRRGRALRSLLGLAFSFPPARARRMVAAILAASDEPDIDPELRAALELDMQPLGQAIASALQSGDVAPLRTLAEELPGLIASPHLTAAVESVLTAALGGDIPPSSAPAGVPASRRFEAARVAQIRQVLPTALGSSALRGALAEDVRARSVFTARGSNTIFLSKLKDVINQVADGEMDRATGRWQLKEVLRAVGYTPTGGFPDDIAGSIPPAVAGSIRDLSGDKRLNFIIDTQVRLMRGRGQQLLGLRPEARRNFPAYELVRVATRRAPRKWGGVEQGVPGQTHDLRNRWDVAGGKMYGLRMIALKADPVWGELGGGGNFDDALDVDYPPFAFSSGMGWREVTRAECVRLGVTGPNGESIDEWQAQDHPLLVDAQSGLPAPQLSMPGTDPALTDEFLTGTGAVMVDHIATPAANLEAVLAQIAARKKLRDALNAQLLRDAIRRRQEEYAARP